MTDEFLKSDNTGLLSSLDSASFDSCDNTIIGTFNSSASFFNLLIVSSIVPLHFINCK